jgi:hypothetical protein
MGKRRNATDQKYTSVLQRRPHSGPPAAADDNDQVEAPAAPKKKGRDPRVKGHTIYFHDDEFELIMVEANRRKQTISEYVVWCLRAAPHQKLSVSRETTPEVKPAPQAEPSPNEAPETDQAAA